MNQQGQIDIDYQNDLRAIEQLNLNKDYSRLAGFGYQVDGKWASRDLVHYVDLLLKVVSALHNADQPAIVRNKDAQVIVLKALGRFDALPVEAIVRLLPYLRDEPVEKDSPIIGSNKWEKQRKANVILWLRAWQRLEAETDKNFNPNDLPEISVRPPKQTRLPSGTDPGRISDPGLRQEYEKAIAANQRKAETYNHQHRLRQIMEWFPRKARTFLINSYSKPPAKNAEMRDLLVKYVPRKSIRDSIMNELLKRPSRQ